MKTISDAAWINGRAKSLGLDLCGIVRPERFPELANTEEWLARGYAGEMKYLENPRRRDPRLAMPGVRSLIVCALNYHTDRPRSIDVTQSETDELRGWVSRYAWGRDYHEVLNEKLASLVAAMRERFAAPFDARVYADTGPVQERILAKHAGLGWLGKNTLLLNANLGSWFFLGVILTTLDLESSLGPGEAPPADLCGTCRRCLDVCPTSALVEPYVMDPRLCISYLTIELRTSIPDRLREPIGRHVFGCDLCQDVCPWNRKAPFTLAREFQPAVLPPKNPVTGDSLASASAKRGEKEESLFFPPLETLAAMSEEDFHRSFRGSAIKRTKWRGLVRNACIALGNARLRRGSRQHARILPLLEKLAASPEPIIAESARWALSRIQ